jgi:hypothetical protein
MCENKNEKTTAATIYEEIQNGRNRRTVKTKRRTFKGTYTSPDLPTLQTTRGVKCFPSLARRANIHHLPCALRQPIDQAHAPNQRVIHSPLVGVGVSLILRIIDGRPVHMRDVFFSASRIQSGYYREVDPLVLVLRALLGEVSQMFVVRQGHRKGDINNESNSPSRGLPPSSGEVGTYWGWRA